MTAPTFVGVGSLNGSVSAASATVSITATAGHLIIAFCQIGGIGGSSGTVTFTCNTNGWTKGGTVNCGADHGSACWAWKIASGGGSPDDATFTWGGENLAWHGQIAEFSGQAGSGFLGSANNANGNSTTLTAASLSVSAASLVYAQLFVMFASQVIGLPSGYTNVATYNDSFGSDQLCYQTPAGSTSTAISQTISSNFWGSFALEIRSVPPSSVDYVARFTMPMGGL